MATAAKLIFGILLLVALFAVGTSWTNRAGSNASLGMFGSGSGQPAVAGTSTGAASTPLGY